jgi:hypothetical protein
MNIYEELKKIGAEMDHHESDLYVKDTPGIAKIIEGYGYRTYPFTNQIDGTTWIDIPFAYTPWWEKRVMK